MKKNLLTILLLVIAGSLYGQATYFWVGGTATVSFTSNSNWNTALNGSGATRPAAASTDILVIDGSNIGGAAPVTGTVTVTISSTTLGQLKLINNATVVFQRPAGGGGTGTMTISGGTGDDLVIESGSSLSLNSTAADGSVQIVFGTGALGRVSGSLSVSNTGSQRISNGSANTTASLVFASGSAFTSNITSASASHPFGSNSQSSEKWVVFESGASLFYLGGWSPMGNNSTFSAIDYKPGSNYHHRATNIIPSVFGSLFNNKSFGNIFVENNATLAADGPIYRIGNLTINAASSFNTHTSGQTAVLGNMIVDGSFVAPAGSTNTLVVGGNTTQTLSGSGTIIIPNFIVADNSDLVLNKSITVNTSAGVFGKINFGSNQLTGPGTFTARVNNTATAVTGNLTAGSYQITGTVGTLASLNGLSISGTGIAPNTNIVGFSSANATINLSQPVTTSGTAVALSFLSDTAVLATAHPSGMDSTHGSVVVVGSKNFQSGTNYIINAATDWPFGISSEATATFINAGFIQINAPVTINKNVNVHSHLTINAKMRLRPRDTVHVMTGAIINGTINSSVYIATGYNSTTGEQSILRYDGLISSTLLPIGSPDNYLPVSINPTAPADFAISVFEGITADGTITGTAFSPAQKQRVVDAVWTINRINGSGDADIQLQWPGALEGSTFTSLPDADIGIITNDGLSWTTPLAAGNNSTNTAAATLNTFGALGIGAVPQLQSFIFNPLPVKIYGDADFNGGASSLNTTEPIVYTSSNLLVATIVAGNIHIVGAGISAITASQTSDGVFPEASATQTLTVNKTELIIKADDKIKTEGDDNPTLTVTYTGFVNGDDENSLLTAPVVTTIATAASAAGAYPITVSGATAANYIISFEDGVLTVNPRLAQTITFNELPVKTYGNADFAAGATSTNNIIPVTYTSSNTNVATILGSNIHIIGAGTATITASQAGNSAFFPATDVARLLTVNKAGLSIRVLDTIKVEGEANPAFTIVYTGFVNGDDAGDLTTPVVVSTIATAASSAGIYTLTPQAAASTDYTITFVAGRLTILPPGGAKQQHLNAFMTSATNLLVRVYTPEPALADIVLFNINGNRVARKNVFLPEGFMNFDLAISSLPSGIYIVAVTGTGIKLRKMISILK